VNAVSRLAQKWPLPKAAKLLQDAEDALCTSARILLPQTARRSVGKGKRRGVNPNILCPGFCFSRSRG